MKSKTRHMMDFMSRSLWLRAVTPETLAWGFWSKFLRQAQSRATRVAVPDGSPVGNTEYRPPLWRDMDDLRNDYVTPCILIHVCTEFQARAELGMPL